MNVSNTVTQLRTTNLEKSIAFYTTVMGFSLEFRFEDFYAGIRAGNQVFHLKLVDDPDPSIEFVRAGDEGDDRPDQRSEVDPVRAAGEDSGQPAYRHQADERPPQHPRPAMGQGDRRIVLEIGE